jgi:hypothetical protein
VCIAVLVSGNPGRDANAQAARPEPVKSLRMYVFDLGNIPVDQGTCSSPRSRWRKAAVASSWAT